MKTKNQIPEEFREPMIKGKLEIDNLSIQRLLYEIVMELQNLRIQLRNMENSSL